MPTVPNDGFAFELIDGALELLDLRRELLRRHAEGYAAKLGNLVALSVNMQAPAARAAFRKAALRTG